MNLSGSQQKKTTGVSLKLVSYLLHETLYSVAGVAALLSTYLAYIGGDKSQFRQKRHAEVHV